MLSKPNVIDMVPEVGDRYEVAMAVAKRARQIEKKRYETGDRDIRDSVDLATEEIYDGKAKVVEDGKYVVDGKEVDNVNSSVIDDSKNIDESKIKAKVDDIKIEEPKAKQKSKVKIQKAEASELTDDKTNDESKEDRNE